MSWLWWNVFGLLAALGSAIFGAMVVIWLRRLSGSERPVAIGIYYNGLGCLVCLVWTLSSGWQLPGENDWLLLAGFAVGCGLQQWFLTVSFRYAQASLLAPFEYLAMIFAAIVGYLFWAEVPVLTTWIGAAIIAASGLYILRREQRMQPAKS